MATDNSNYDIVQLSESDWAIQYSDGSLVSGYPDRQNAIDSAAEIAATTVVEVNTGAPRNLEEAMVIAQSARDSYRSYLSNNPTTTQEQRDAYEVDIVRADAYVSEYQAQTQPTLNQVLGTKEAWSADQEIQRQNADKARIDASANAAALRAGGATPQQIEEADKEAFQTELYYQGINKQKTDATSGKAGPTDGTQSGLFDGGQRNFANQFGQVISSDSNISGSSSSTLDITRTSLGNEFGNIGNTGTLNQSIASGNGTTSYQGNIIYDMSIGVRPKTTTSEQRVKLSPKPSIASKMMTGVLEPLKETGGLVFPYTPVITVQGSTNYNTLETTHANQNWHIYQNTPSIDLSISGKFTAQNETEAKYLLACIHFLRVLTKMRFGASEENKGLPPPQVFLDGYGTHMFNGLSVILKSYDLSLDDDVDYVNVNSGGGISKVPTLTGITILCTVQQTPAKAKEFNWDNFASGNQMKGWL